MTNPLQTAGSQVSPELVLKACNAMIEQSEIGCSVIGFGAGKFAKTLMAAPSVRFVAQATAFRGFFDEQATPGQTLAGFPVSYVSDRLLSSGAVMLCTDTPGHIRRMEGYLENHHYAGTIISFPARPESPKLAARRQQLSRQRHIPDGDRLHLGCGTNLLEGWINADWIEESSAPPGTAEKSDRIFIMDATKAFPFQNDQMQYIFCEDFIEHFDQQQGVHIIAECSRILRPGGIWRISTPSFDANLEVQCLSKGAAGIWHGGWEWGHKLLYSKTYLLPILKRAGFDPVDEVPSRSSSNPILCNIDTRTHQKNLIVDAIKRVSAQ